MFRLITDLRVIVFFGLLWLVQFHFNYSCDGENSVTYVSRDMRALWLLLL